MKKQFLFVLALFTLLLTACDSGGKTKSYNEGINLVPTPKSLTAKEGVFKLTPKTVFVVTDEELASVPGYFVDKIRKSTGYELATTSQPAGQSILLKLNKQLNLKDEGYQLRITPSAIEIEAKTAQGAFYGMQTVMQLLPAEIENKQLAKGIAWELPCVEIEDEPNYPYRGMMLDVCRHFHDAEFVKKQLDLMAMYKMNRFHWHLTEDHLWAIEIKKYPELTKIGSIRKNADGSIHQGFYTQEQIKDVVAYAAERHITVIPEIELPGHALAALTVFPELSCTGGPFQLRNKWGVEEDVYCAGNEATFAFLEDIIDEVCQLFPGEYFHIGGDECPKDRWNNCPKCKKRMKDEKLKDAHELQSYFVHRAEQMVNARGKKMIGWDEILEGGLAPSATVMSWRGEEGGIEAASMGHDVIMSPGKWLYLDHGQGAVEVEPIAIKFPLLMESTYNYDPTSMKIPENLRHHVLGAQCNMWTEYATTPDYTEYLLYPRMLAVAELNWTPVEKKNYDCFNKRLNNQLVRLDAHAVNYYIPVPEGPMGDQIALLDSVTLTFTNNRQLPMVYSLDPNAAVTAFTSYESPITIKEDAQLRIASVLPSGKMSRIRTINVQRSPLQPALSIDSQSGIQMTRAEGEFYFVRDVENAKWGPTQVVKSMDIKPDLEEKGAFLFTGYFDVPEDGVYFLSTEMDQLKVNGKTVLSNDGKLVRHSHTRTSLALQKGKHAFELLMINNNIGGYPRRWNNKGFVMARQGDSLQAPVGFSY